MFKQNLSIHYIEAIDPENQRCWSKRSLPCRRKWSSGPSAVAGRWREAENQRVPRYWGHPALSAVQPAGISASLSGGIILHWNAHVRFERIHESILSRDTIRVLHLQAVSLRGHIAEDGWTRLVGLLQNTLAVTDVADECSFLVDPCLPPSWGPTSAPSSQQLSSLILFYLPPASQQVQCKPFLRLIDQEFFSDHFLEEPSCILLVVVQWTLWEI